MQELERERLAREDKLELNTRLSCQIRVHGDLHIKVLRQSSVTGLEPGTVPAE
jgi:ferredoxin